MQIYIAKNSGFCKGVKNAVETAKKICGKGVYILGELIHNDSVIKQIENTGTITAYSISQIPNGSKVIIRSHGIEKQTYTELENKGCEIIDCTCPFVKRTQKIIADKSSNGFSVIIVGEKEHPEVLGLLGWCDGKGIVSDGDNLDYTALTEKKVCIVAQTTFSNEKFAYFLKKFD